MLSKRRTTRFSARLTARLLVKEASSSFWSAIFPVFAVCFETERRVFRAA
jgi:hypothetical protein